MASGASICTSEKRMTTLTESEAPSTASAAIDSGSQVNSANTMVERPNSATTANITMPICRPIG